MAERPRLGGHCGRRAVAVYIARANAPTVLRRIRVRSPRCGTIKGMHAWAGVLIKSPRPNSAVARPNTRGDPAAGAVLAPVEPPQVATTPSFLEAAHRAFSMPLPRPPGRRNPVQRGEGSPQRHRGLGPTPEVGRTRHPGAASSAHNHDTPALAAPPEDRGALPRPVHVEWVKMGPISVQKI